MARASRRQRWDLQSLLVSALLLVVGVAGVALLGSSLGWFGDGRPSQRGAPAGTIAIPAAAVPIATYTRVSLDHLIDPRTGDLLAIYLPEGSILPETFVDAKAIVGRVLAVDKKPGQLFSEADFFPPGTREGIVAGIPAGKRAMRIDATKVGGIVGLGRGDRFDLVATLDMARAAGRGVRMQTTAAAGLGQLGSSVQATTVVAGGAVVQPLASRTIPGRSQVVVQEMVIAVAPSEVAALTEALHTGARIDCVPLSGQPVAAEANGASSEGAKPQRSLSMVETITGSDRRVIAVRPGPPTEAPAVGTGPPSAQNGR